MKNNLLFFALVFATGANASRPAPAAAAASSSENRLDAATLQAKKKGLYYFEAKAKSLMFLIPRVPTPTLQEVLQDDFDDESSNLQNELYKTNQQMKPLFDVLKDTDLLTAQEKQDFPVALSLMDDSYRVCHERVEKRTRSVVFINTVMRPMTGLSAEEIVRRTAEGRGMPTHGLDHLPLGHQLSVIVEGLCTLAGKSDAESHQIFSQMNQVFLDVQAKQANKEKKDKEEK